MIERAQLEEWFPDEDFLTVPVSALPRELTNGPLRELLTGVGVPESFLDVVEMEIDMVNHIGTVEEFYRSQDGQAPVGTGSLWYLGFAGHPLLCVDGVTGDTVQVHKRFGARPLCGSLEDFLRVLGFVSGEVRAYRQERRTDIEDFAAQLSENALAQLGRTDPAALPGAEPAWRELLSNIVEAMT